MRKNEGTALRLSNEELDLLTTITTEYGITKAEALRLGLQLFFDNDANCRLKKTGKKVWKE